MAYAYAGYWEDALQDDQGNALASVSVNVWVPGSTTAAWTLYQGSGTAKTARTTPPSSDSLGNITLYGEVGWAEIEYNGQRRAIYFQADAAEIDAKIAAAIATLGGSTYSLPDATASVKGGIELGGDLAGTGGTASAPKLTDALRALVTGALQSANANTALGPVVTDSGNHIPTALLPSMGSTYQGTAIYVSAPGNGVYGDGSHDDLAALQTVINNSVVGSTIIFDAKTYLVSGPLRLKANRAYIGLGYPRSGGARIKLANGANITATGGPVTGVVVSDEWFTNATAGGGPIRIERIAFDANKANNTGTACGLVLMNYWADIIDCAFENTPSHGLMLASATQNGTALPTGTTGSATHVVRPYINNTGGHGFYQQVASANNNLDGILEDGDISSTGLDGVHFDAVAGWYVRHNHLYGIVQSGMVCNGAFASHITDNYVEDFGNQNTAGTYYAGISVTAVPGWGTKVTNNQVGCPEPTGSAHFQYYSLSGQGTDARITFAMNSATSSGSANSIGLVAGGTGGGHLFLTQGLQDWDGFTTPELIDGATTSLTPLNSGPGVLVVNYDYTAVANQVVLADSTAANRTITLPALVASGTTVTVKKIAAANTVTVSAGTAQVDGASSYALTTLNQSVTVVSNGSNWYVT